MYIKMLEANGLKGGNFKHELTPNTLFAGPNFSGKTARMLAIRLAILGYIPELGKKSSATYDLAAGNSMSVALTLSDGGTIRRELFREGETIRSGEGSSDSGGDLINSAIPLLDAKQYFGLTPAGRIQYIFSMMQVSADFTVEGILAGCKNIPLEEHSEHTEKANAAILAMIEGAIKTNGITGGITELTRDGGVLKTQFTYHNKRQKETQGTLRILSELKTREKECSADTIASVTQELREVEKQLESANTESGKLMRAQMDANKVKMRIEEIDEELAKKPDDKKDDQEIKTQEGLIKDATKLIDKTAKQERVDELFHAWQNLEREADGPRNERDITQNQIDELEGAAKAKPKVCDHCGAKPEHQTRSKTAKARLKTLKANLKKIEQDVKTAEDKVAKAEEKHTAAKSKLQETQRAQQLVAQAQAVIDAINQRRRQRDVRYKTLREERGRLKSSETPSSDDLTKAATKITELKEKKTALDSRRQQATQLQQDLKRAEEAAAEHHKSNAYVEVIKTVGKLLKERQENMIEVLFGSLMQTANYFTNGILKKPLVFHNGEVGYFTDTGTFVTWRTFSGTEEALTYIAVAAALSKDSPIRIALLDEMGRLDPVNKEKVLRRLRNATKEGVLDQVIAIDTITPEEPSDWQVIELKPAA